MAGLWGCLVALLGCSETNVVAKLWQVSAASLTRNPKQREGLVWRLL